jgi:hypothetical protein
VIVNTQIVLCGNTLISSTKPGGPRLAAGPIAYKPWARQIAIATNMSMIDTARFMGLVTIAEADAVQSVYAAKWYYLFWRPMTAIRNGDIDGNDATERDPTWEPIDNTPLHPEYPCAHCILSGAVTTVIQKVIGTNNIPEVSISTPTAPGVVRKATNLDAIADEIALNTHLCRFPLSQLDRGRAGDGSEDRRVCGCKRLAADVFARSVCCAILDQHTSGRGSIRLA